MIDPVLLRENPELVKRSQEARGESADLVDEALAADSARRAAITAFEELRAAQNAHGKTGRAGAEGREGRAGRPGQGTERPGQAGAARRDRGGERMPMRSSRASRTSSSTACPPGARTTSSRCARTASRRSFDFEPRDHLELGELLGAIDMERGTKVSGSRFYFLTRHRRAPRARAHDPGARPRAAGRVHPDRAADARAAGGHARHRIPRPALRRGVPPRRRRPLPRRHERGAARRLPHGRDPRLRARSRSATPAGRPATGARPGRTARTPAASSACTSSTSSRCSSTRRPTTPRPSTSASCAMQEGMLQDLGLAYRVIDIAAGDLGSSAARKFDVEAWVPTQGAYRELTSTSNCTTYQARRLDIRYRPRRRQDRAGRDPQRHARHDPVDRRAARDPPARRRLGDGARGAAAVSRRSRGHGADRVTRRPPAAHRQRRGRRPAEGRRSSSSRSRATPRTRMSRPSDCSSCSTSTARCCSKTSR